MNDNTKRCNEICNQIIRPHIRLNGAITAGPLMVDLEGIVAATLLTMCKVQRPDADDKTLSQMANGYLDALQYGVTERIGMIEGKPYRGK